MSLDPYYIVKDILVHANRFSGSESMLLQRTPAGYGVPFYHPVFQVERDLAVAAFYIDRLHFEYQRIVGDLSKPPFTIALRREINAFPKITKARLLRWGWDYVLSPNGLDRVRDRIEAHERTKYYALLDAARSWREGENITSPHAGADRLADEAISIGIMPTMTPEEGEKEISPRYDKWYLASALGEKLPHVTLDEHGQLGHAIDRMAGLFGREVSPEKLREYAEFNRQAEASTGERPNQPDEDKGKPEWSADFPKATSLDDLTPTAWKILKVLRDLGAVNSEKALSRARIAEKAGTGNYDSKHNQEAFALLADCELIIGKRRVGTWLTSAGMSAANGCK